MKKKTIITMIVSIGIIAIIIFLFFCYNSSETGNTTINKTEEEMIQDILNISFYRVQLQIKVTSNKNENQYVVKQEVTKNKIEQEILQPENIAGVVTTYEEGKLTLYNSRLELSQVYEDYAYMTNNALWLHSFIEEFKNNAEKTKISYEGNNIVLEVKNERKYDYQKKLYINKENGKPIQLIVQDINQKQTISIEYTELELL